MKRYRGFIYDKACRFLFIRLIIFNNTVFLYDISNLIPIRNKLFKLTFKDTK